MLKVWPHLNLKWNHIWLVVDLDFILQNPCIMGKHHPYFHEKWKKSERYWSCVYLGPWMRGPPNRLKADVKKLSRDSLLCIPSARTENNCWKNHMSSRCSGSTPIPCLGGTQRRTLSTKTSAQGQAHDGAASEMARGGSVHKDLREGMG